MIDRSTMINEFLGLFENPSYLEIGVNKGETFNKITAARKVAVDPKFLFDTTSYSVTGKVDFYEMRSDTFFSEIAGSLQAYDVVFIDGLHTFEQTLRDLLNAMMFSTPKSIMVIDDVLPDSYDASLPDLDQVYRLHNEAAKSGAHWPSSSSWMGDVFKIPFFIESFLSQFSYATVRETQGQTVVWREVRPVTALVSRSMETIARLDYRDTVLGRGSFNIQSFDIILSRVKAHAVV